MPLSTFGGDESPMMDDVPPPKYSDERNQRFKLIPRIVGGPWMVRKAVGSTPVLLGTKIRHRSDAVCLSARQAYKYEGAMVRMHRGFGSSTARVLLRNEWRIVFVDLIIKVMWQCRCSLPLRAWMIGCAFC